MGLIVDLFAGGGGASLGIEMALGRHVDIAVNHDPEAVALHTANHPSTRHLCGDVWDVQPREVCAGRPVDLLWASPDCTYHSKARGGKPHRDPTKATGRRGLADVVVRWAREVRPEWIFLENVEEFQDWGPLDENGKPVRACKGQDFRRWVGEITAEGYNVEWREMRACDFGAPTNRKRLFVAAARGKAIVWPEPTHGPGRIPYRTAADCIDWSIACPSIFGRKRPLVEKTLARVARGIRRFVFEAPRPFIVGGAIPVLIHSGNGERKGQAPRVYDVQRPTNTVVAEGVKLALVAAFIAKHYGGHEATGSSLHEPLHTVTTSGQQSLVRAFLTQYNGTSVGQALGAPFNTITTKDRFGVVTIEGVDYEITDIGFRMLRPRELYRAQSFPDSYMIDVPGPSGATLTQTAQIRMCGNSVCPEHARAVVAANLRAKLAVAC